MRAINVINQVCELVVRNRLLVTLEHLPLRFVSKNADVRCGVKRQRKEEAKECQTPQAVSLRHLKPLKR